ncbi:hypothetical protein BJ878DRAFT_539703 [Calycina marina]|uniref:Uncharacterized protein n=1 Tax=Calycina marina TaxID=1763456 RepID=A0A9P8CHP8_9HELO|nr:hypothetical protein BJ878DRAFT_539703 [Calycina marina]
MNSSSATMLLPIPTLPIGNGGKPLTNTARHKYYIIIIAILATVVLMQLLYLVILCCVCKRLRTNGKKEVEDLPVNRNDGAMGLPQRLEL